MGPLSQMFRRLPGLGLVGCCMLVTTPSLAGSGVSSTRHNLSASGPGEVRATGETEVCIFCHAGHVEELSGPLWNRTSMGQPAYRPYQSGDLSAGGDQPNGVTLLCMSCHDGTVAVSPASDRDDQLRVSGTNGGRLGPDQGGLGTDLSGTHPVSIDYRSAMTRQATMTSTTRLLAEPRLGDGSSLLDAQGQVQCTSCHDPHEDPQASGVDVPPFWVGGSMDDVCTACHQAPLVDRGHSDSAKLPRGCGSCHVGHGVERQPMLPKAEEDSCFSCHGSNADRATAEGEGQLGRGAAPASVQAQFDKPFTHPVRQTHNVHSPSEDLREDVTTPRHVECADCHPVHGDPTYSTASTLYQRGIARTGTVGGRVEQDLCYDCHGSVSSLPFGETDKSAEFSPSNESFHPVDAPLGKRDQPSLLSPWVSGDRMSCGDCHGSDDAKDPAGPHGSNNRWILRWPYEAADGNAESEATYQACYSCHSRTSILSNESFEGHNQHIIDAETSCYACHDSHGSPNEPGLIRFGKDFRYSQVLPSTSGRLEYQKTAGGTCYLSCHGVDHDPLSYP